MADSPTTRKPGGQPGNSNALRHGLFRRAKLTAHTLDLLADSRDHGTVGDVIDLLRAEMVRMVEGADYRHGELAALAGALAKFVALEAKLNPTERSALDTAIDTVLADLRAATGGP